MSISQLWPKIARTCLKTHSIFHQKLRCPRLPMASMSAQEKKLGGILPNFGEDGIFQNLGPALNSIPRSFSFQSGKEKEKKEEEEPILPRNQSLLDVVEGEEDGVAARSDSDFSRHLMGSNGQRRRRNGNFQENLLPGMPVRRQQSFREDVGHAAAETYLLTGLSFKLLRYLGVGYRWITKFLALGCYAMLLMPGFLQVGYYYFTSQQVRRSIVYGAERRNRLDLYMPSHVDEPKPVVAFVTGGAWIIGYKAWGALLGQGLAERDVIVACIDYRNFPQGTISDMINDASQGISFVCNNISAYGGDPNRIYVMGQSAGAHIAACVLMEQAQKESSGIGECSWSISQIKSYFGISGGYNLPSLVEHFHQRGLYRSIFLSVMEGEQSLLRFSPEAFVRDENNRNAVSRLPPIVLFHGTKDCSIPYDASKTFADALVSSGARVELIVYEGKTHTDLFLQDPLRGGHDDLLHNILNVIHADNPVAQAEDASAPPRRRLVPELMIKLARRISPF